MVCFLCKHFSLRENRSHGHAKTSVTSPLLKKIKFKAFKLTRKYLINVENFVIKFQVIIGNHCFEITVGF